ncbi:hypothetical protein GJ744_001210 [Endocarpon pusillum]|uniref:Uncharacterized protein n=1 Tax=Endocarpon pusillum TaxID=364733 RepID=A0A8H7ACW1_9EURO|nr:hypothetical protein GJ744_001210 [Endocarpon pusillum]
MQSTIVLSLFISFLPAILAWEAGFWSTDGRNLQAYGRYGLCDNLISNPPLRLGQVTFDAKAGGIPPYPNTIQVFSNIGCDLRDLIYQGGPSRTGRHVSPPSVAKSYLVGWSPIPKRPYPAPLHQLSERSPEAEPEAGPEANAEVEAEAGITYEYVAERSAEPEAGEISHGSIINRTPEANAETGEISGGEIIERSADAEPTSEADIIWTFAGPPEDEENNGKPPPPPSRFFAERDEEPEAENDWAFATPRDAGEE